MGEQRPKSKLGRTSTKMIKELSTKFEHLVELVMTLAQNVPPGSAHRVVGDPRLKELEDIASARPPPLQIPSASANVGPQPSVLKDYHNIVEDMVTKKLRSFMNNQVPHSMEGNLQKPYEAGLTKVLSI